MTKSFYVIALDVDKTFATEKGNEVTLNASTVDFQRGSLFGPSFVGNFACTGIRELCVAKITKAQGFWLSISPCVFFNLSGILALVRCLERGDGLLAGIFCCKYAKISDGKPTLPAVYEILNNEGLASILVNANAKSFCFLIPNDKPFIFGFESFDRALRKFHFHDGHTCPGQHWGYRNSG